MPKAPTLEQFAKMTRKNRGGPRSPLEDNAAALADTLRFRDLKTAGKTDASWQQFADWLAKAHGVRIRPSTLVGWLWNHRDLKGRADG